MNPQKKTKNQKLQTHTESSCDTDNVSLYLSPVFVDRIYDPLIWIGSPDFLKGFLSDFYRDKNIGE